MHTVLLLSCFGARAVGQYIEKIELIPADVGSGSASVFTDFPTNNPSTYLGRSTSSSFRSVNFNTAPDGALVEGGFVNNQYASRGVTMNDIRISASIYGGNHYGEGFATENDPPQVYTFDPPVIAFGIVNTSPDNDLIEFFSGPEATGELLFSFRDQEGMARNFDIDRFVGGIAREGARIGSVRVSNTSGNLELDEMVFALPLEPCLDVSQLPANLDYDTHIVEVLVPGRSNPFLAGQPDGAATKGDRVPDQSPVFATEVTAGDVLSFAAVGGVTFTGATPLPSATPDGGSSVGSSASALGIAGYGGADWLPYNALVGVFLGDEVPADPAPDRFGYGTNRLAEEIFAPGLHQVFFIGDGLTGTGSGTRQQFVVPPGATRLFLGTTDGFGWYNNAGEFSVAICRLEDRLKLTQLEPTSIRFDQNAYTVDFGEEIMGTIEIDPLPPGGLYSQGLLIEIRDLAGSFAGVISPAVAPLLDFDGPVVDGTASAPGGAGAGGVKGSANFSITRTSLMNPQLGSFRISDLPSGNYTLTLLPWNDLGPSEDIFVTGGCLTLDPYITFGSAEISVSGPVVPDEVLPGTIVLEPQTGLLEQKVIIKNNTGSRIESFRFFVRGLPDDISVWNAHGMIDGVPYFDMNSPLEPGASIELLVEYYRASRQTDFTPEFDLALTADDPTDNDNATPLAVDLRVVAKPGGGILVEFQTEPGRRYFIEYTDDLTSWKRSVPEVQGDGRRIQWLDQGPPKTRTAPGAGRFYRLVDAEDTP